MGASAAGRLGGAGLFDGVPALALSSELPSSIDGDGSASGRGAWRRPACGRAALVVGLLSPSGGAGMAAEVGWRLAAGSSVARSAQTEELHRFACFSCFSFSAFASMRMLTKAWAERSSVSDDSGWMVRCTEPHSCQARVKSAPGSSDPASCRSSAKVLMRRRDQRRELARRQMGDAAHPPPRYNNIILVGALAPSSAGPAPRHFCTLPAPQSWQSGAKAPTWWLTCFCSFLWSS
eukprot:scaffold24349_cov111-Isochrysis_galbana.AAC.2